MNPAWKTSRKVQFAATYTYGRNVGAQFYAGEKKTRKS